LCSILRRELERLNKEKVRWEKLTMELLVKAEY
jgi:hypothetical protein